MEISYDFSFYFKSGCQFAVVDGEFFVKDRPLLNRVDAALRALVQLVDAFLDKVYHHWAALSFRDCCDWVIGIELSEEEALNQRI